MAAMGYCEDYLRLPLTSMEEAHKERLLALMKEQNLI
jgi:4-hydroxy-tetrahydrodipicolinate synthase